MIEIRFHGRGGQGAVVASKVLASAVFLEGKYVQSFPAFGVERRGAPVVAFTRIDTNPIRIRTEIYAPEHIVVLDPTLVKVIDITAGLKDGGTILINSSHFPQWVKEKNFKTGIVDASSIAVKHKLGSISAPIVNTAILGAFAKFSNIVSIETIKKAIMEEVPYKSEDNAQAAEEAFNALKIYG